MRIMALDVGDKTIGVAMTDPTSTIVQPVTTLERKGMGADVARTFQLVRDHGVGRLIIGLPLDVEGRPGPQAQKVLEFKEKAARLLKRKNEKVVVETWDETMTTHEAHEEMAALGIKHSERMRVIDKMAAVMILESWLSARGGGPNINDQAPRYK